MIGVRVLGVLAILLIISFFTFALLYLAPGDIVRNLIGNRQVSPETVEAIRQQYHLNDPFFVRYLDWLGGAVRGDFGTSIRLQVPVSEAIGSRLGLSVSLMLMAFVFAVVTAVPLGIRCAANEGGRLDRIVSALALLGLSAPSFALAILLITVFALMLPIFPAYGAGNGFFGLLWSLVLPAVVLAMGIGAILLRMTRAAMLRELEGDAVLFARARGLSESRVQKIALRGALIPIVTSAGLILTFIIGGTIIVETVFALPGIGLLLQQAVLFKDFPVVQGVTLLIAGAIAIITLVVDLSYLALDPRVRHRAVSR